MKNYKLYIVGGFVRDKLLGVDSKDVDYAFEFSDEFFREFRTSTPNWFYREMNAILEAEGYEIFLETPDCFTTRAKFPKGHINEKLTADFVMCRKENYPDKTSRQPLVEVGNLYDDLLRRDFRLNAMALTEDGVLIDPFNGEKDLKNRILSCPIDAETSFMDDPLRAIRCLRFAATKNFLINDDCKFALRDRRIWEKFEVVVSRERVREELLKMFKYNTFLALKILNDHVSPRVLRDVIFKDDMWLKPSVEKRT